MHLAPGHLRPQLAVQAACPGRSGEKRGGAVNRPPPGAEGLWGRVPCQKELQLPPLGHHVLGEVEDIKSEWRRVDIGDGATELADQGGGPTF